MKEKIIEIISQLSKVSIEEVKAKQDEKGLWDSFTHVELVLALEDEFAIMFSSEEIGEIKTVSQIIQNVSAKLEP